MRLVKFLANCGVASRRKSEELISAGRVSVDGKTVFDPALDVDEDSQVMFDRKQVRLPDKGDLSYILFHKPVGVIASLKDEKADGELLTDYIQVEARVFPVGRLDRDSSGLLLLTNDGEMTQALTHPRRHVEKEYILRLNPAMTLADFRKVKQGVEIEGRKVEVDKFVSLSRNRVNIVIHEGRNRILRKLFGHLHYSVSELKRTRLGTLGLGSIPPGKWRYLTEREVHRLKKLTGLTT
ncbi:pseudouridine synthase [Calditrichota bacterium]